VALSFADYARGLDGTPDLDPPDPRETGVELKLLVDEAWIGCTSAMLLCLDREQRLAYVLGEIMGATDVLAAEVLGLTRAAFRQRLARARRDLHSFMTAKCGLVDRANPCRCARKTRGFMQRGYVDPRKLLFAREHVERVRDHARRERPAMDGYDGACTDVYRDQPFYEASGLAARVREIVTSPAFKETFGL
jgi:hypothetical protein